MNAPTDLTGEEPRGRSGLDRRLVILMGARLGLSLLSLGLVLALDAATGSVNVPARRGQAAQWRSKESGSKPRPSGCGLGQ